MTESSLQSSLWQRRLARLEPAERDLYRAVLHGRAAWVWARTDGPQRRSFFSAGLGYEAGAFIDSNIDTLIRELCAAETALESDQGDVAGRTLCDLAEKLFALRPFAPRRLPNTWRTIIANWVRGTPLADIVETHGTEASDFIHETVIYKLVWAVEALRVQAIAKEHVSAALLSGAVPNALTYGVTTRQAALVLQAGLPSRAMAIRALSKGCPRHIFGSRRNAVMA